MLTNLVEYREVDLERPERNGPLFIYPFQSKIEFKSKFDGFCFAAYVDPRAINAGMCQLIVVSETAVLFVEPSADYSFFREFEKYSKGKAGKRGHDDRISAVEETIHIEIENDDTRQKRGILYQFPHGVKLTDRMDKYHHDTGVVPHNCWSYYYEAFTKNNSRYHVFKFPCEWFVADIATKTKLTRNYTVDAIDQALDGMNLNG